MKNVVNFIDIMQSCINLLASYGMKKRDKNDIESHTNCKWLVVPRNMEAEIKFRKKSIHLLPDTSYKQSFKQGVFDVVV